MITMKHLKQTLGAITIGICTLGLSGPGQSKEIVIAAGELPPHIDEAGNGREAEIIKSSLEACGHTAKFVVKPFTRHWALYEKDKSVEAVTTVPVGMPLPGFASTPYIKFHNGVSVLSESGLTPSSLSDLAGKKVVAFAGAEGILPGLKDASSQFKSYDEKADQLSQSRLLFAKRIDAVIGDGLIFSEYNAQLREQAKSKKLSFDPSQSVKFYAAFDPTPYALVFRDEALQKDFDKCYGELKAAGTIDSINQSYIDKHKEVVGSEYQGL